MSSVAPEVVRNESEGLQAVPFQPHATPYAPTVNQSPGKVGSRYQTYASPERQEGLQRTTKIAGLRPRPFWFVLALIGLIIVGASVGGAVGGTRCHDGPLPAVSVASSTITVTVTTNTQNLRSSSSDSATSSSASALPTLAPSFSDCPNSDGTTYTPAYPSGGRGSQVFLKSCAADTDGSDIGSAYVQSFDMCITMCANYNVIQEETICTFATFLLDGTPPNNCWMKNGTAFVTVDGAQGALLQDR